MCDINCIWLFNLLVAFVLIIQQQQHNVVVVADATTNSLKDHHLQQQRHLQALPHGSKQQRSAYADITSYASASAAKYLHQHSLPKANVVKREIRNDKNTDFISYLSDFNMQDETSIPEDIFDQRYLKEIEERERNGVGVGSVTTAAESDGVEGVDVIDVNLPYDDSDADAEADIILESQRSSERNFSSNDDNISKNNANDGFDDGTRPGIVYMAEVKPQQDVGVKTADTSMKTSYSKKDTTFKEKKKMNFNFGSDKPKQRGLSQANDETSSPRFTYDFQAQDFLKDSWGQDNYEDELDDDEEDDDDGSAEYERFKCLREQKQREVQQQKEREEQQRILQQQQQELLRQQQQQQQKAQQLYSIKKLKERKFNKASLSELEKFTPEEQDDHDSNAAADDDDDEQLNEENLDDNAAGQDKNANVNNNDDNDDDETKIVYDKPSSQQLQQQPGPIQDAIGDIADEVNEEKQNSFQVSNVEKKDFSNLFIPHKMKRHNGAARLDDATNRHTRIRQQKLQQSSSSSSSSSHHFGRPTTNSKEDNARMDDIYNQEEYMPHIPTKEINYPKSYYGNENGNASQNSEGQHNQQQPKQFKDSNSQTSSDIEMKEQYSSHKESETLMAVTTAAPSSSTVANHEAEYRRQSLFEREKSLRRNSKRYGHKTHKKKYKDYLHYSSVMMMRQSPPTPSAREATEATAATNTTSYAGMEKTTSAPAASTKLIKMDENNKHRNDNAEDNLRYHKDKYAKKLKMEKLRGAVVPPSPIFVIKPSSRGPPMMAGVTSKPFYEGQINYYLETEDDDDALMGGRGNEARFITKGDRMDTNDWYRKLSPVLRNGVKTSSSSGTNQEDRPTPMGAMTRPAHNDSRGSALQGTPGYTPYHHLRSHHQRHHQHHQQHTHGHQHHQHSRNHAYQRKMLPKKPLMLSTTPQPPPARKHDPSAAVAADNVHSHMQELGHQITDLKEFERYYAKWPHLARVQSQLHDEQLREQLELQNLQQQQLGQYQDYEYDEDYFEALQGMSAAPNAREANSEENLPPYIRKYNRRNKQLLDLLEGTLPPPTTRPPPQLRWSGSKVQPGSRDTSNVGSMSVRIDDDYLKEKRKRYHQRQKQIHDLFEQQRGTTTTMAPTPYAYDGNSKDSQKGSSSGNNNDAQMANHLPDEDVSISLETQEEHTNEPNRNWQKEIATKSTKSASSLSPSSSSNTGNLPIHWQMEKIITPSPKSATGVDMASANNVATPKPAIFKLPSYPSIAGSFMQRPRSRSAQFAPSSGSEFRRVTPNLYGANGNNNFINAGGYVAYNGHNKAAKSMASRFSGNEEKRTTALPPSSAMVVSDTNDTSKSKNNQGASAAASSASSTSSRSSKSSASSSSSSSSSSPASVSNSFVYHRVVDASPRLVGAGLTGRKQRLPFVAITDRRLETSKKSLTDHQKDFEQNHYPLP
ncbi:basic-leucine zipper transcription factor A [Stomoxys calcitrans]|uniref:basic-leucine zipper transcription factor A n=1 Tax=Stomoxys calcitrans TaxID=35570 RepID=UPI0027E2D088|nr:basic-leucine zipper transcription factor A [Stomoxys calcitrans]XP_059222461.1 basic-leucine zipper transcription factor A [Stomoxys calcitrans]